MIPPSWLFTVWGLDILGPFPRAIGGYQYLYIAMDKFTKWPEATPVVKVNKKSIVNCDRTTSEMRGPSSRIRIG
jgi:hypothetical protein